MYTFKSQDVVEMATIAYHDITMIGICTQYILITANGHLVQELVEKLERYVTMSTHTIYWTKIRSILSRDAFLSVHIYSFTIENLENNTSIFLKTEILLSRVSGFVIQSVLASCVVYSIAPGVIQGYAVATGTVNNETFVASFNDEFVWCLLITVKKQTIL